MQLVKRQALPLAATILVLIVALYPAVLAETQVTVTLKVLKDGEPLANVPFDIYKGDEKIYSGTTGSDGTATIENLTDGTSYKVYVYYKGQVYSKSFKASANAVWEFEIGYITAIYANWLWIAVGAGALLVLLVVFGFVKLGGRRGSMSPAAAGVFFLIAGMGMALAAILVQKGYLQALDAAFMGVGFVVFGALLPLLAGKIRRR